MKKTALKLSKLHFTKETIANLQSNAVTGGISIACITKPDEPTCGAHCGTLTWGTEPSFCRACNPPSVAVC